jgi:hypothetical protein
MINSGFQVICIKNMKDIIGAYSEVSNLIHVSEENVEKALLEIADIKIKPTITVKQALCNLKNYRPEIRYAFELQLFNLWYEAFKNLDVDHEGDIESESLSSAAKEAIEVEGILEEPSVMEESEPEVEDLVEELAVIEELESKVEDLVEELAVTEEPEPEIKDLVEEPAVIEEVESEVKEIGEEPGVLEKIEPEVSENIIEIAEEPVVAEESESKIEDIAEKPSVTEESKPEVEETISGKTPEPIEKEQEMKWFKEDEQEAVEKKIESPEESLAEDNETERFPKRHRRDWFDFLLDTSGALMKFIIRIFSRKRS